MLAFSSTFALETVDDDGDNPKTPGPRGIGIKHPYVSPVITYNALSTTLNITFPATNNGKVEIYRNGSLVVSTNATAGASLNYMLRNYGTGNYTIIVSCGSTVIYSNNVEVK